MVEGEFRMRFVDEVPIKLKYDLQKLAFRYVTPSGEVLSENTMENLIVKLYTKAGLLIAVTHSSVGRK